MYSVIKYQDLEYCFTRTLISANNAAYKGSVKVVEMTGIEPATP